MLLVGGSVIHQGTSIPPPPLTFLKVKDQLECGGHILAQGSSLFHPRLQRPLHRRRRQTHRQQSLIQRK